MDKPARCGCCRDAGELPDNEKGGKRRKVYKEHIQTAEMAALHPKVQAGIKAGRYIRATLQMNRYNPTEGWIMHPEDNMVGCELLCML